MPPAVEAWSLNHWTTGEVPNVLIFIIICAPPPAPLECKLLEGKDLCFFLSFFFFKGSLFCFPTLYIHPGASSSTWHQKVLNL